MLVAPLGTMLRLTRQWSFPLKREYRNSDLMSYFNTGPRTYEKGEVDKIVTLPEGTVLKLDRIYVRKGVSDYDSLTFRIVPKDRKDKLKGRFFAALSDCNQMGYELI